MNGLALSYTYTSPKRSNVGWAYDNHGNLTADPQEKRREIQPNANSAARGWIFLWQNGPAGHFCPGEVHLEGCRGPIRWISP